MKKEIRVCDCCGKPMKEGFVLGGCELACSRECAIKLYGGDEKAFNEDLSLADTDEGDTYYTEWESLEVEY